MVNKDSNERDTKSNIYSYYFDLQDKYSNIYGNKTLVLVQIGKFYEAYNTKKKGYINLAELEPMLNIKFIRRDNDPDCNKPNQFGINMVSISKHLNTLVEKGFTVVLFDQIAVTDDSKIERECAGVFSAGTYISDKQMSDTNYLLGVYIEEEKQLTGKKTLMAIGLTLVDLSTGKSMVHEFYSNKLDEKFGLDELVRIMQTFRPKEIVIYYRPVVIDADVVKHIKLYLELDKYRNHQFYTFFEKKGDDKLNLLVEETFKINYQNDYLSKIFDLNYQLNLGKKQSAIEILNLEKKSYAVISLMIILKYISEHNVLLLKNLSYPTVYLYSKHLILGNNAIEQLNIIDSNNLELFDHKIESLFDVVNKTSTPMGRRFLRENLLNPLSQENRELMKSRYEMIDVIMQNKLAKKLKEELKNIFDMEKLHRLMAMGTIMPFQFYRLDKFYQSATKIYSLIKKDKELVKLISENTIKEFLSVQFAYNKEYDFEKLQNFSNFIDIDGSFFKKGIHPEIDKIQDKIDYVMSLISSINLYLTSLVSSQCKKIGNREILGSESNDKEGYYFTISKTNESILKKKLEKKSTLKIDLSVGETLEIKKEDIIYKPLVKGRTKIFVTPMVEHTLNLTSLKIKLAKLIKRIFIKSMLDYYSNHRIMMYNITNFIAEIDFLVSGAIVAEQYAYCKPSIPSADIIPSYFKTKQIRHSIIERLCTETEYVPNDIELGNIPEKINCNGVVLFSLNWAGKSSFMKSIGIAIILAQIGYFVPASEFVFEPYMALYARITGNDNIFKGLSSFALEMTELDAILMRTEQQGSSTLVIGDEVCRGTEDISGRAIVASALVSLGECSSTFIFSSHMHDIQTLPEIQQMSNLRFFHLRAEYDEENDCIIFDRRLVPGSGPSVYGLMVAKYIIKNAKFINRAEIIKKRLMSEGKIDIPTKKSNYNNKLLVTDCAICHYAPTSSFHKELETHHIHFQSDCKSDGKIKSKPYLHKNMLYNLVVLCRKCHNSVHQGEIIINGYADTSFGPMLDYKVDCKKKILNSIKKVDKLGFEKKTISKSAQLAA